METTVRTQSEFKQSTKACLKDRYGFPKTVGILGIIAVEDPAIRDFLIEGFSELDVGAVVLGEGRNEPPIAFDSSVNGNDLAGFDFFIFDNEHDGVDVVKFMKAGIVPIMPEKNTFSGILKEFNPMKFEGNGFFWKKDKRFCVLEKAMAYLENVKFPEDRRVLVKNVMETF